MKKIRIPILYLLSFAVSVLPVAIYFFANADRYFVTVPDKVKLTCGLVCMLVIVFLKVMGKLKMPSRAVLFALVMVMCYLLERVLDDLIVFSFLALIGEILDMICQHFIKKAKEERMLQKSADRTAKEIERVLNGRV